MLRYLYNEKVNLNERNVMQVLYVAKKYILPSLADECIDFLERNVDTTNVFDILSHAHQYDEENLADKCWEVIDRKTGEALRSERFATVERSLLEAIVKRNSLTVREVDLFKAVDLWAAKECERQGLAADGKVKRRILGEEIVKGIRFPAMEEVEFVSTVLDGKIIGENEVYDLMRTSMECLLHLSDFQKTNELAPFNHVVDLGHCSLLISMEGGITINRALMGLSLKVTKT